MTGTSSHLSSRWVLGTRVDATSYRDATQRILGWAGNAESRYVCVANVNNVMEANEDPSFLDVMNGADLVTPDGMPLVWALKLLGERGATRVRGPRLLPDLLRASAAAGIPVGFLGSTDEVLTALQRNAVAHAPGLKIVYAESPPFRPLTAQEDAATIEDINASGVRLLFVGLGCPKQERWMADHRGTVGAVVVGVGAAFDFLAGTKREAPGWMQRSGLEWLFRLLSEPRRLWRRYLRHNPRFVVRFAEQLVRGRGRSSPTASGDHEKGSR